MLERAQREYAEKPIKLIFGSKWCLIGIISQFCFERIHDNTDLRFVFKLHRNRPLESGRNGALFSDKKVRKMRFFAAILRPFGGGRAKSLQVSVSHEQTSRCKILSQLVPISWSYFRKIDFVRPQYMPSAYN